MKQINFNLRIPTAQRPTTIFLVYRYKGNRLKLSTGLSILPAYWNSKKQCAKDLREFRESVSINVENTAKVTPLFRAKLTP